jgi:hypothetical protein
MGVYCIHHGQGSGLAHVPDTVGKSKIDHAKLSSKSSSNAAQPLDHQLPSTLLQRSAVKGGMEHWLAHVTA